MGNGSAMADARKNCLDRVILKLPSQRAKELLTGTGNCMRKCYGSPSAILNDGEQCQTRPNSSQRLEAKVLPSSGAEASVRDGVSIGRVKR
jgi:hypothetical protein